MASNRRKGLETSATRVMLLDAVEAVMVEKGYAAVTARSVADRAGLKYQLVFYYFQSMDDLLLAAYRRRIERVRERVEQALASDRPLHAFWEVSSEPSDAALTMEYLALSNHNALIRAETVEFGEVLRRLVAVRLPQQIGQATPDPTLFTPLAISVTLANIGAILGLEATVGISGGHEETKAMVGWCLRHLEPATAEDRR